MTSNCFFIKRSSLNSSSAFLNGDEHHHLSKVARIGPEEKVYLFDEQGTTYLARVEEVGKQRTRLSILEKKEKQEPKLMITLAQALIKSKKMEFILQKSTELGVTAFIPVITARSIIKIEGKTKQKLDRWQKLAREAAKQSHRSFIPTILPPQPLKKLIEERNEVIKLLLSENRGKYLRDILLSNTHSQGPQKSSPSSVLVLIGPEGGWTEEEEKDILDHGYQAVSLGKHSLRAETAAFSTLAIITHFWNF